MKETSLYVVSGMLTVLSILAMLVVAFIGTNDQQKNIFPFAATHQTDLVSPVPTPLIEKATTEYAFESPIPYGDVIENEALARSN